MAQIRTSDGKILEIVPQGQEARVGWDLVLTILEQRRKARLATDQSEQRGSGKDPIQDDQGTGE